MALVLEATMEYTTRGGRLSCSVLYDEEGLLLLMPVAIIVGALCY